MAGVVIIPYAWEEMALAFACTWVSTKYCLTFATHYFINVFTVYFVWGIHFPCFVNTCILAIEIWPGKQWLLPKLFAVYIVKEAHWVIGVGHINRHICARADNGN